jgi:uncharacterized protein YjbI with pentapeptide repeats
MGTLNSLPLQRLVRQLLPCVCGFSGGGGISTPVSGQDLSNQDLRKRSFTKAIMRQTNFSNSNLQGVSFFGGLAVSNLRVHNPPTALAVIAHRQGDAVLPSCIKTLRR